MRPGERAAPVIPARRPSSAQVIRAYLVLPHAVPILVVLATTASIALIAADGLPATGDFLALLLAMLGGQIAIGAVNELVDAPLDAKVKPSKPIPAGLVTQRGARLLTGAGVVVMIICAALLGWASLLLCGAGTAVGIVYSLWFKRTILAWLPYLIALPLLPLWVFSAIDRFDARLLLLYPLGAFAVVGVHLSQSLPDIAADRASGVDNLTARLGERPALALTLAAQLVSSALALLAALWWASLLPVAVAAGVVVALVLLTAGLFVWRPRTGVLACFPCVAIATSALGIGWILGLQ